MFQIAIEFVSIIVLLIISSPVDPHLYQGMRGIPKGAICPPDLACATPLY